MAATPSKSSSVERSPRATESSASRGSPRGGSAGIARSRARPISWSRCLQHTSLRTSPARGCPISKEDHDAASSKHWPRGSTARTRKTRRTTSHARRAASCGSPERTVGSDCAQPWRACRSIIATRSTASDRLGPTAGTSCSRSPVSMERPTTSSSRSARCFAWRATSANPTSYASAASRSWSSSPTGICRRATPGTANPSRMASNACVSN
jgi:hypothetical protein